MLWLLTACRPAADVPDSSAAAPYRVVWADLHAHTNLSMDGCEDEGDACTARTTPASDALENAVEAGLDVVSLTDHAEFLEHEDLETGQVSNIWDTTLARVADAPDGLIAYPGYEWTAHCAGAQNIHRTVVLEEAAPCSDWRVPSCVLPARKEQFGREAYTENPAVKVTHSDQLEDFLGDVPTFEGCSESRWLAYIHHPGVTTPAGIDWSATGPLMSTERLVEVYSEHGSSECTDLTSPGCDWQVNTEFHAPEGSIQAMLETGHRMGFLAGTDSHDGRPGSIDAPGPSGQYVDTDGDDLADVVTPHHSPGGITAVLLPVDADLGRSQVFEALLDRRTIAASAALDPLVVVLEPDILPGRAVEAGTYTLRLELPEDATWEWVRPDGSVVEEPTELVLEAGDVGYVRVRTDEHRAWASPWWVSAAPR
ncbi:MAG: hypothetical protein GY913_09770 [Proteobacteria bacterium]|nr:hypothetical protein [Pseudomonadota bacterium]MCP4917199.1 hypothetical protein [Pseudomonadota bacterium]